MTRRGDTLLYWHSHQTAKLGRADREGAWHIGRARHVVKGEVLSINPDPTRDDLPPLRKRAGLWHDGHGKVKPTHVVTVDHRPGATDALDAMHDHYCVSRLGPAGEYLGPLGPWSEWHELTYTADLTAATGQQVIATVRGIRDWIVSWADSQEAC